MDPETYLTQIVSGMIEDKDALKIERTQDDMGILLSVLVAKNDIGRLIGKKGETASSIRRLLRINGLMQRQTVSVKFLDAVEVS